MFNLSLLFRMILSLFILYSISKAADQDTVTAVIPADFAPHYLIDKDGNPTGFAVEVFNEVAKIAGLKVRYLIKPNFPEAFKTLKNAEADVIPNAGITSKRAEYSLFSVPMETFVIGAFKRSGSPGIKTLEDMHNRKVVAVKNNIGVKLMQQHPSQLLKIADNQREALFSLLTGESDIWVYPVPVVQKILINTGLEERAEQFGKPLKEIKRAIQTVKSKPELAGKLDAALRTFLKTPRFHEIYEKWYGKPSPWWTIERILWILGSLFFAMVVIMAYWRYLSVQQINRLLAKNVNDLNKTKNILEEYKDSLEEQVKERTEELQKEFQKHMAAENTLRRFKDTLDQTLDCVFMFYADTLKFFYVNHGAIQQVGYTAEEMMEMTPLNIKTAFTEKSFRKMITPLISGEQPSTTFETVHKHKDGTLIPVEVFLQYITQKDEEPSFLAIARDITERKRTEAQLLTIDRFRSRFIERKDPFSIHDSLRDDLLELTGSQYGFIGEVLHDPDGTPYMIAYSLSNLAWDDNTRRLYETYKNKGFKFRKLDNLFGWVITHEEVVISNDPGTDPRSGGFPPDHPKIHSFLGIPVYFGPKLVGIIGLANRPGGYDEALVEYLKPIVLACGQIITARQDREARRIAESELNALNKDLQQKVDEETAKRLRHEHLLVQQSKMAAMGEMIGAIAHQWRQPLNNVSLQAQEIEDILEYEGGDPKQLLNVKETLIKSVKFMSQTIEDFRNFFKPSREKELFMACESAEEVFRLIAAQAKSHGITLYVGDHEHFHVLGYRNEFNQVLLNLFNNARDAIIDNKIKHGLISVAIENDGKTGTIRIRDNGGGIPETLLPKKLFEPYETTKGEQGTGIGLYISKTIVESHMGGAISVQNIEDGAEFKIVLPLARL